MQPCNVAIRVSVVRPLCLSEYPKHKIKCCSVLQFSLAPVVFLFFGRIVIFLCRNRFPDTVLYMAAVANATTRKFDLSCRPLSAQRACMANTRDAPTNLMSEVCMEQCTGRVRYVHFYFRCDYRYVITGTTFISYAINSIVLYQVPRVNKPFI